MFEQPARSLLLQLTLYPLQQTGLPLALQVTEQAPPEDDELELDELLLDEEELDEDEPDELEELDDEELELDEELVQVLQVLGTVTLTVLLQTL